MEDFFNRIGKILENEGINITTLEQQIGASKGVLSRAKRNNTSISMEWIMNLVAKYQQYDANWLLTGRGDMLKKEGVMQQAQGNVSSTITQHQTIHAPEEYQELKEENKRLVQENSQLKDKIIMLMEEKMRAK